MIYCRIEVESNTGIKFATHLATLRLETPDFTRPLIGHVITARKTSYCLIQCERQLETKTPFLFRTGSSALSRMASRTSFSNHLAFMSRMTTSSGLKEEALVGSLVEFC